MGEGVLEVKPRERLLKSGPQALSNEELIAILLRTGDEGKGVLELSKELLERFPRLSELMSASLGELMSIKGIGLAKATSLKAAFELGKRLHMELVSNSKKLDSPRKVADFCMDMVFHHSEILRVIGVDNGLRYLAHKDFQSSLKNAVEVGVKEVFSFLLRVGADAFFLAHNHRNVREPSAEDINITRKIRSASDILGIKLVDHVIVHPNGYVSFREKGMV